MSSSALQKTSRNPSADASVKAHRWSPQRCRSNRSCCEVGWTTKRKQLSYFRTQLKGFKGHSDTHTHTRTRLSLIHCIWLIYVCVWTSKLLLKHDGVCADTHMTSQSHDSRSNNQCCNTKLSTRSHERLPLVTTAERADDQDNHWIHEYLWSDF